MFSRREQHTLGVTYRADGVREPNRDRPEGVVAGSGLGVEAEAKSFLTHPQRGRPDPLDFDDWKAAWKIHESMIWRTGSPDDTSMASQRSVVSVFPNWFLVR